MEDLNDQDEEGRSADDEEEYSEEDVEESYSEKARRQIESNDPALVKLAITGSEGGAYYDGGYNSYYHPTDGDWERDGKSIGRNTNLKEVTFGSPWGMVKEDSVKFFLGLASNRSIKKLSFCNFDLFHEEIFCILIPFFKENRNFECLVIDEENNIRPEYLRTLTSALEIFDSLKEFELSDGDEAGQGDAPAREVKELIQALSGHSGLQKLYLCVVPIGRDGCTALSSLLMNQGSNIAVLNLEYSGIDDEDAIFLATGLTGSSTLRELNLSGNRIISQPGWQAIFDALQSPNGTLEELDLSSNRFNNRTMMALANSLATNKKLRKLDLSDNHDVTAAGWQAFSAVLQNLDSALEILDLSFNQIDDDASNYLANAMANSDQLRELNLRYNFAVSAAGWQAFSAFLRNPNSALEKLNLRGNYINDRTMISLANSLVNNIKLKELLIDNSRARLPAHGVTADGWGALSITADGWGAFLPVLCNTSNIMATYHSNHTLEKLCDDDVEDEFPEDIKSLLCLNRENRRSQAARLKIINTHFNGSSIGMQPFIGMGLNVLPSAISWMGRDGIGTEETWGEGFDLLYQFSRAMLPTFYSINGSGTKRKRGI